MIIPGTYLGPFIKKKREEQLLTQAKTAFCLKISPQFLGRIEKGLSPIPKKVLFRSMSFLNLESDEVIKLINKSLQLELTSLKSELKSNKH